MTFEQIEEFCVVARLENFTKAAEYLYVSQSTLSRHISDLESSLGVQLMRRDNRVFELTEAGKVFYTEMRDLLRRAEAIKIKTQQVSRGKIGELSIASFSPHIPYVFERIREFRRRNSEINCRITTADNTEIVEKIVAGELDIGLVFSFEVPPCRGVKQITVGRDDLCVVVPNDHRLASYSTVALSGIKGENVLALQPKKIPMLLETMDLLGYTSGRRVEFVIQDSVDSMILHTRLGDGISILPRIIAQERAGDCRILGISDYATGYDLSLCWREDNNNPVLDEFLAYFRD